MDALLISMISACTALVASIVAPFVTLAVARRQFSANVLSANRQKWIESLRDLIAELISLFATALVVKLEWKENWDRGLGPLRANPKLIQKLERIVLVQWKIRLLINPTEHDHEQLYLAIVSAFRRLETVDMHQADTEADMDHIATLAQVILKREWQRVKSGT
jgi:hypothetical protein